MNKLETQLQNDLTEAMKQHNEITVGAIRAVKTAIQNEKTTGTYHELSEGDVVKIIQKQIKQRQESESIYRTAGRTELADKEANEIKALEAYVPKTLSAEESYSAIDSVMAEIGATTMKDMGKVMAALREKYPQIDGKIASTYVKSKLG